MGKVMLQIDEKQLEAAVNQLDMDGKVKLVNMLARETRKERWDRVVMGIRSKYVRNPVSEQEVLRICEKSREERYGRKAKSSR